MRPVSLRDARPLALAFNDFELARQTGTIPYPLTVEQMRFRIRNWIKRQGDTQFGMTILHGREVIGHLGMGHAVSGHWNLGYTLRRSCWGHGLATEAAQAFCAFGLRTLRVDVIEADVFVDNAASRKVLKKIGFVPRKGRSDAWSTARGERVPVFNYMLTRKRLKYYAA